MSKILLSLLVSFLALASCTKDNAASPSSLYYTWEAKSFVSLESVAYPKTEGKKILLTFNSSGKVSLKLEINGCGSNFTISNPGEIKIDSFMCTEACCDSQFSSKLVTMLSQVTSYEIEKNNLKLNVPGWGYIQLELAD